MALAANQELVDTPQCQAVVEIHDLAPPAFTVGAAARGPELPLMRVAVTGLAVFVGELLEHKLMLRMKRLFFEVFRGLGMAIDAFNLAMLPL